MSEITQQQKRIEYAKQLLNQVESSHGIEKLINLMAALRDPQGGCPWDKKQTYQSILPFTIEEVYEVAEAIESNDFSELKNELGDLLFQIVFYAQMAKEDQRFDFNEIVESICDKLLTRHPHVFAGAAYQDEKQLDKAWESQKHKERNVKQNLTKSSVLDDIPKALPELKRAHKIQKRVAKVGFDWPDVSFVWNKLEEECKEVKEAAESDVQEHLEEELGDMLFVLVNLSRHYGVDADRALRKANQKFEKRFRKVEDIAEHNVENFSLEELEAMWQQAKKLIS